MRSPSRAWRIPCAIPCRSLGIAHYHSTIGKRIKVFDSQGLAPVLGATVLFAPLAPSPSVEQLETVRRREAVERDVPIIRRNRFHQALHGPADTDQPRMAFLQADERSVVMALAPAETRPAAV